MLTVDLGGFHLASDMLRGQRQSVVLVDARDGKEQGTVLHHPLFEKLATNGQAIPGELLAAAYHVPAALVAGQGTLDYVDPLSKYAEQAGLAQNDSGRLLAASSPVLPPIGAAPDISIRDLSSSSNPITTRSSSRRGSLASRSCEAASGCLSSSPPAHSRCSTSSLARCEN